MKKINRAQLLFVLGLAILAWAGPARADRIVVGDYILYDNYNSGGQPMTSGTTVLHDAKGSLLGARNGNAGYTFTPGVIGALATIEETQVLLSFPLKIERAADAPGSALKIFWDPLQVSNPDIYSMSGNGSGQYLNTYEATVWTKIYANGAKVVSPFLGGAIDDTVPNQFTLAGQVGAGSPEVYFRALPPAANPNNVDIFVSSPAVGKINAAVYGNGKYNLIGVPLLQANNEISQVLSTELNKIGIEFLKFDNLNQQYAGAYYDGNWQGSALTLSHGEGVWVYNPTAADLTLTIVGGVPVGLELARKVSGGNKYNLIALPHSQGGTLSSLGLAAETGSEILLFDNAAQSYVGTYVENGHWKDELFIPPARGFWYYKTGSDFNWLAYIK